MQLVLFIPDFVLAGEPEVLRSCQVMMAGEQCHRIHDAIERCHVAADAPALQPFRICAHKHTAMRGLEAVPEAMAIGVVELANERGNVSLKVRAATCDRTHVIDEPMNTFVAPDDPYEGAIAISEVREAFLQHQKSRQTTFFSKIRDEGLYGVLVNLRLTTLRKNASNVVPGDQFEFAVGLPLYDAAGCVIDLRRYSVLSGVARDALKPAAELLKQIAL
jgi:hypothetical protein